MDTPASSEPLPARQLLRRNGPLYRQLATILRRPIAEGAYPVGAVLPKEADLADRFGVSLITVRQALRELEADGLIRKRAAKPAVVAARLPKPRNTGVYRSLADIQSYTTGAKLQVMSYRRERSAIASETFGLPAGESCYCLRGILMVDDRADTHVTTFFPPDIGRRLAKSDFDDVLIFRAIEKHLGIQIGKAHIAVKAEVADAATAHDLSCETGSPILLIEMLYYSSEGQPVELTFGRHRADVFSLSYDVTNT